MKGPTLQDAGPLEREPTKIPQPTVRQTFGGGRVSKEAAI
jgi:hypothetical protein